MMLKWFRLTGGMELGRGGELPREPPFNGRNSIRQHVEAENIGVVTKVVQRKLYAEGVDHSPLGWSHVVR